MFNRRWWIRIGLVPLLGAMPATALAADRFDLGLRFNAVGGSGEPTNDVLGVGVYGRYWIKERWRIGLAIDHADGFDFERPALLLGLPADFSGGDIDAEGTATYVGAWIERAYPRLGHRLEWFWSAGLAGGLVDVDRVSGPLVGGGSYTIVTEMDGELGVEEVVVGASGGVRMSLGARSALEVALHADRHVADWELLDLESGATGRVDDYLIRGVSIGYVLRFSRGGPEPPSRDGRDP